LGPKGFADVETMEINGKALEAHRNMQAEFFRTCFMYHQSNNRTWTLYTDTDEFLVIDSTNVANTSQKMQQHGIAWDLIAEAHKYPQRNISSDKAPNNRLELDCISLKREQYTSHESPRSHVTNQVPSFLDPYRFQTLRYRHSMKAGLMGKSIVDVSKFDFRHQQIRVHRLLAACIDGWGSSGTWMHVNHYLGSLEAYKRPNDARGSGTRTQKWFDLNKWYRTSITPLFGDETRPWIEGFVSHFGVERSKELLAEIGHPFIQSTALEEIDASCGKNCVASPRRHGVHAIKPR